MVGVEGDGKTKRPPETGGRIHMTHMEEDSCVVSLRAPLSRQERPRHRRLPLHRDVPSTIARAQLVERDSVLAGDDGLDEMDATIERRALQQVDHATARERAR